MDSRGALRDAGVPITAGYSPPIRGFVLRWSFFWAGALAVLAPWGFAQSVGEKVVVIVPDAEIKVRFDAVAKASGQCDMTIAGSLSSSPASVSP